MDHYPNVLFKATLVGPCYTTDVPYIDMKHSGSTIRHNYQTQPNQKFKINIAVKHFFRLSQNQSTAKFEERNSLIYSFIYNKISPIHTRLIAFLRLKHKIDNIVNTANFASGQYELPCRYLKTS